MNDLSDSLTRLLDSYNVYDNNIRYTLIKESIQELFENMDEEKQDQLRLLLFEEGIKRLAGI